MNNDHDDIRTPNPGCIIDNEDCYKGMRFSGLCPFHHRRSVAWNTTDPTILARPKNKYKERKIPIKKSHPEPLPGQCEILNSTDCVYEGTLIAGFCHYHWMRYRTYGDPLADDNGTRPTEFACRVLDKKLGPHISGIHKDGICWRHYNRIHLAKMAKRMGLRVVKGL